MTYVFGGQNGLTNRFEGMNAADVMENRGLNWEVGLKSIFCDGVLIPDKKALAHLGTGKIFDIVGTRYVPIQNREVFTFFDDVVSDGKAEYIAAGDFNGGLREFRNVASSRPYLCM